MNPTHSDRVTMVHDATVERDGSKLKVKIESGIGWYLTFVHEDSSEADAEAWLKHINASYEKSTMERNSREDGLINEIEELVEAKMSLERKVAALRGTITRLRRELGRE